MKPRRRFADRGGFTLVEVLVAFTVMAMLVAVLYRGVVVVRAGSLAFDERTHRQLVARTVLDEALAQRDLKNGTYSGRREGIFWSLIAKPIDLSEQMPPPAEAAGRDPQAPQNSQAPAAQPVATGAKNVAAKGDRLAWLPQRLRVRVGGSGRPLEIETIRLVKAK